MFLKFFALILALVLSSATALPSKAFAEEKAKESTSQTASNDSKAKPIVSETATAAAAALMGLPPSALSSDKGAKEPSTAPQKGDLPDPNDPVAVAKHYCTSPRAAAKVVFGWLDNSEYTAAQSTRCMFPGEGKNPKTRDELIQHAMQLRELVAEKGVRLDLDSLSNDPEFKNAEGFAKVEFSKDLPGVYMRRFEGMWGVTPKALAKIEVTYKNSRSFFTAERMDAFPTFLQETAFGVALWQFIAIILLLMLGLTARKFIYFILTTQLTSISKRIGKEWLQRFVEAGLSPLTTLLMAGIFALAYPQLNLPSRIDTILSFTIHILTIFSCVWFCYRISDVLCDLMAQHASKTETKLDDQLVPLVRRILKVTIIIVGFLFILQNLSVDIGSLLAGLGIGGIAIAMAAKDTISNFFGSIVIFTDKPFQIGDWVVIDGAEGVVEVVGFRSTQIRTFYDSVITVPNSMVANAKIDNYGLRNYRRCSTELKIALNTKPEQIQAFVEGVRAILRASPITRKDYYEVHLSAFGPYAYEVMLYFFLKCNNWSEELAGKHNVFMEIIRLAKALDVHFAYPTQTLYHEFVAAPGAPKMDPQDVPLEVLQQTVSDFAPNGNRSRPQMVQIDGGWTVKDKDPREIQPKAAPAEGA